MLWETISKTLEFNLVFKKKFQVNLIDNSLIDFYSVFFIQLIWFNLAWNLIGKLHIYYIYFMILAFPYSRMVFVGILI